MTTQVDPSRADNLPVLYSDYVMLEVDKYGVKLDFTQPGMPEPRSIVTRLGMTLEAAKKFHEDLGKELEL